MNGLLLLALLVLASTAASSNNITTNSLSAQENGSFIVVPFMLFDREHQFHGSSPPYVFDAAGNIHTVDVMTNRSEYPFFIHLWTNLSTGRVESRKIADYYWQFYLAGCVPLFPNAASGGIDFLYWPRITHPFDSPHAFEFFQYSWNATGATTRQIATFETLESTFEDLFGVVWNGTHPIVFHLAIGPYQFTELDPQMNISVLWPGESAFLFVGALAGLDLIDARVDESERLILWVSEMIAHDKTRLTAWRVSREDLACVANFTFTNEWFFTMAS
ncbi:MAG: hypothetical protein ACXAB4_08780, partial [Candidatus Hodarchaeales archaeon]